MSSENLEQSGEQPEAPQQQNSLWRDIVEAIRGKADRDYTSGSIGRAILYLSIPMVLEMAMESVFAVVDIFFVSKLGADAVTAVGLTESVIILIYAVAIGVSMAGTAMIARRIGEKDKEAACNAAVQIIGLGVLLAIPGMIAGMFWADDMLRFMGAPESSIEIGSGYTTILFGGNIVIMLLFLNNAIFRGAGDAAIAMRALWLSNGLNLILDPCLIFGLGPFPELGVPGAAIATTIGRGAGVCFQLYVMFRGSSRIQLLRRHVKLQWQVIVRLIRVSAWGVVQYLLATASWLILIRIIARFGSQAVAGYTIAIRFVVFTILPSWGMANAAATLVGQNLGANKPDRAEKSVWITSHYNMAFLLFISVFFIFYPEMIIGIFTQEEAVIGFGADCLRIMSYGYALFAYGMVVSQAFNGAGDTRTPTKINFLCYWLLQIPLAYYLAVGSGFETVGVYWSITTAEVALAATAVFFFRRGKWKAQQI